MAIGDPFSTTYQGAFQGSSALGQAIQQIAGQYAATMEKKQEERKAEIAREKELEGFFKVIEKMTGIPTTPESLTEVEVTGIRKTGQVPQRFTSPTGGIKLPGITTPTTPTKQPFRIRPTFAGGKLGFSTEFAKEPTIKEKAFESVSKGQTLPGFSLEETKKLTGIPGTKKPSLQSLKKMAQTEAFRQVGGGIMGQAKMTTDPVFRQRYLDLVDKLYSGYRQEFGVGEGITTKPQKETVIDTEGFETINW